MNVDTINIVNTHVKDKDLTILKLNDMFPYQPDIEKVYERYILYFHSITCRGSSPMRYPRFSLDSFLRIQ